MLVIVESNVHYRHMVNPRRGTLQEQKRTYWQGEYCLLDIIQRCIPIE